MTATNSDMTVYDRLAQTSYYETIQDNLAVFNAASNGCIILDSVNIEGDFDKSAFFTLPDNMADRDVNNTDDIAANGLGTDEMIGVKYPWAFTPTAATEEAFKRVAKSPDEFALLFGERLAETFMQRAIAAAFASLDAAIEGNAAMSVGGVWATDHKKVITKALRPYGDMANKVSLLAMDSTQYFNMVDDAIAEKVYEEAGFVIYGGMPGTMNRPVLVTDRAPASKVFGLTQGAVTITESQETGVITERKGGKTNIVRSFQAEGAFNVEVEGYKYAGAANPTLAALGASASWTKYAASDKATAASRVVIT